MMFSAFCFEIWWQYTVNCFDILWQFSVNHFDILWQYSFNYFDVLRQYSVYVLTVCYNILLTVLTSCDNTVLTILTFCDKNFNLSTRTSTGGYGIPATNWLCPRHTNLLNRAYTLNCEKCREQQTHYVWCVSINHSFLM